VCDIAEQAIIYLSVFRAFHVNTNDNGLQQTSAAAHGEMQLP